MLGEKETYKYLGILKMEPIKNVMMKGKFLKRSQENKKTTRSQKNLIKEINTMTFFLVGYLG